MKRDDFRILSELAQLQERRAQDRLRDCLSAEDALAREAAGLDVLRREAIAGEGTDAARRATGADDAWQTWLTLRRTRVGQDHAMARARLDDAMSQARSAFSRADAASALFRRAESSARQERDVRELRCLEALALLQRWSSRR